MGIIAFKLIDVIFLESTVWIKRFIWKQKKKLFFAKRYGWTDFIRISNTDIVNFFKVTKLDMSLTGVIKVNFINGKNAIVSRRYMSKIKKDLLNIHRH